MLVEVIFSTHKVPFQDLLWCKRRYITKIVNLRERAHFVQSFKLRYLGCDIQNIHLLLICEIRGLILSTPLWWSRQCDRSMNASTSFSLASIWALCPVNLSSCSCFCSRLAWSCSSLKIGSTVLNHWVRASSLSPNSDHCSNTWSSFITMSSGDG